jgi:hypothetical protein
MKNLCYILFLSALTLVSCKKSNPVAADNSSMTVTIDGATYNLTGGGIGGTINGLPVITLSGTDGRNMYVFFDLDNVTTTGTYNIGIDSGGIAHHTVDMDFHPDSTKEYSSLTGPNPTGKFIITELTASSISATFSATLTRQKGTGDSTVTFTNGSLSIRY